MSTEITMPKLSDTMTEGVLVAWRKNIGERVERGEILAEVETDKANMELESFTSGTLLETRANPGDTVAVGSIIAVIGEQGETSGAKPVEKSAERRDEERATEPPKAESGEEPPSSSEKAATGTAAPPSSAKETPKETTAEETKKEAEAREASGLGELGEGVTAAAGKAEGIPPSHGGKDGAAPVAAGPDRASPLVRRLAREKEVDLAQVRGSGPEGRILREDLDRYVSEPERQGKPQPAKEQSLQEGQIPLSRIRGAIARKVVETWQSTPHFAVTAEIDMGEVERLYRGLKQAERSISLNDFIIKACAGALQRYPSVNASFSAGGMVNPGTIDIGIVVALEEGVVIPVVRHCDRLPLLEIAAESHRLADLARSGKITEDAMNGGTFTISNLGMYGIDEFFAVINSPQAAILAVGAVADKPFVRNGSLVAGRLMRATLSADHRLLDGAVAAQFMAELKRILENPVAILV